MQDLKAVAERVRSRRQAVSAPEPVPTPALPVAAPPLTLPVWAEAVRGLPNSVLRSSLFGVVRRGRRASLFRQRMASIGGVDLLFSGVRLDQGDLDVWAYCLHLSRTKGESLVQMGGRYFLRGIDRAASGQNLRWLTDSLVRLKVANIEVRDGKRGYIGSLLDHAMWDEKTGCFFIVLNPLVVELYGDTGWTAVEADQRRALRGQPLAQWLHAFYSTHMNPYSYKVDTLRQLCGSENGELRDFRRELRDAAERVQQVTGWQMVVDSTDQLQVRKGRRRVPSALLAGVM